MNITPFWTIRSPSFILNSSSLIAYIIIVCSLLCTTTIYSMVYYSILSTFALYVKLLIFPYTQNTPTISTTIAIPNKITNRGANSLNI